MRSLEDSGIAVAMLIAPSLEAVKAAHGVGVTAVEFYTGATVDLPARERRPGLEALADAATLASKLRMSVSVGGGLDYRNVTEVLPSVASAKCISVLRRQGRRPPCARLVVGSLARAGGGTPPRRGPHPASSRRGRAGGRTPRCDADHAHADPRCRLLHRPCRSRGAPGSAASTTGACGRARGCG